MRSGTENVPGIAGIGAAAKEVYDNFDAKIENLYALRHNFIEQLKTIDSVVINGFENRTDEADSFSKGPAPHIVSASFENIRAEVLLHALEEKGVYVSSGSACSSNHPAISGTLKAIGVGKKYLDATLRFSFCLETTKEELDYCIGQLKVLVPMLRRYTAGGRR